MGKKTKEVAKTHSLILVDVDSENHKRLVRAVNSRKYDFESHRKGYCRPHMSEMKLYNIRAKKEVMPFILRDLGASSIIPEKKIRIIDIIKGPGQSGKDAFFDGRIKLVAGYLIQKLGKLVRIQPPVVSKRKRIPFIDGWCYTHVLGNIEDINRGHGEELALLVPLGIAFILKFITQHLYILGS